jgi:hypothetical protein
MRSPAPPPPPQTVCRRGCNKNFANFCPNFRKNTLSCSFHILAIKRAVPRARPTWKDKDITSYGSWSGSWLFAKFGFGARPRFLMTYKNYWKKRIRLLWSTLLSYMSFSSRPSRKDFWSLISAKGSYVLKMWFFFSILISSHSFLCSALY